MNKLDQRKKNLVESGLTAYFLTSFVFAMVVRNILPAESFPSWVFVLIIFIAGGGMAFFLNKTVTAEGLDGFPVVIMKVLFITALFWVILIAIVAAAWNNIPLPMFTGIYSFPN